MNEHARRELEPPATLLRRGSLGPDVKRLQEWLSLHGFHTAVDGDFGPTTESALIAFQRHEEAEHNGPGAWTYGEANDVAWAILTAPLHRTAMPPPGHHGDAGAAIASMAQRHLVAHPREVGKPNGGPWVRYYCRGQEVPWCAGFATAVLSQALGHDDWHTLSCDELAKKAHERGVLAMGMTHATTKMVTPGSLFLVRRPDRRYVNDWIHTGIVTFVGPDYFETIEGNTNTDGSREGTVVHARTRAFNARTDFVLTGGR